MPKTFEEFVTGRTAEISVVEVLINLGLAAVLAGLLAWVYVRHGAALSNRRRFAQNFGLLTLITMLVITIVKSSLALSLGLVGALSIVRFRAAIKEPEELTYLFLAIAIGLGFGANQRLVTIVAVGFIMILLIVRGSMRPAEEAQNLFLTVANEGDQEVGLEQVVRTLQEHCSRIDLKRFDETNGVLEASFLVEVEGFEQLEASRTALKALGDSITVTFVDNRGLG